MYDILKNSRKVMENSLFTLNLFVFLCFYSFFPFFNNTRLNMEFHGKPHESKEKYLLIEYEEVYSCFIVYVHVNKL